MDGIAHAGGVWQGAPRGHEWCHAALRDSPITLAACDAELRYVWVLNPPRPFTLEEIVGRKDSEILPEKDIGELVALKAEVLASGRGARRQIRVTSMEEVRYFDITAEPVTDPNGPVGGLSLAAVEVTEFWRQGQDEQRALERERAARAAAERRRQEAERQVASRSKLMRGFSHEVRNPLSAALGYVELVTAGVKGPLNGEQRLFLQRARRSIGAAVGLLEDLLALARAEAGGLALRPAPADLAATLRDVADTYRAQAQVAGLELRLELADTLPRIETDAARVRQILSNLVSNAVKYTARGTVGIRAVAGEQAGGPGPGRWIAVEVWDTGPGIPEEVHERIFEEFTRLETGSAAGFGLGLAVSRMLARALGGEVTVRSRVGEGSTFTLWLPAGGPAGATPS